MSERQREGEREQGFSLFYLFLPIYPFQHIHEMYIYAGLELFFFLKNTSIGKTMKMLTKVHILYSNVRNPGHLTSIKLTENSEFNMW